MAVSLDPRIKLRHLSAFLETVRHHGVARAGDELGMTQPAVSKSIAELEAILGVALFDRTRRALTLTPAGDLFLRFAQAGIATLRQGVETLAEAQRGTSFIAFGALPTVTAGVVPRALQRFASSSFACRTLVESGPSPYLLELLRNAAVDFVVGRLADPRVMDGLSFEHLYSEELALVVRPGHPLAAQVALELRSLEAFQLLLPPRQAIIRPAVDALLIAGGIGRTVNEIETVSNSLGRSYTLLSDAIWIISHSVVAGDLETGQLLRLAIDTRATRGPIGITTRSGVELGLPARALLDAVRLSVA